MNKPMNKMVSYARITLGVGTKKINTTNSIDFRLIVWTIVHQNPASPLVLILNM